MPDGWGTYLGGIDDETSFCPEHVEVDDWASSQCPGCVGSWGECSLWESFAYSDDRRDLTEDDMAKIEAGICPRRTNGSFVFDMRSGSMSSVDESEPGPTPSGRVLAQAIRNYCDKYPGNSR